jgi:tyrosyl-tRNA synthetase
MYPLMQGYDSVQVKSDVELGGNDQYFNLLAGRKIQKFYGQAPQDIVTFEFLVGLDGRKMATSWGNGIYITDSPQEMFGKIMTLQDELILEYFRLATDVSLSQIEAYSQQLQAGANPRDIKLELAKALVRRYHSEEEAQTAQEEFIRVFAEKALPESMPEITITLAKIEFRPVDLVSQVFQVSKSESRRLLQSSGVRCYPNTVLTLDADLQGWQGQTQVLQKGKRHFVKVTFE